MPAPRFLLALCVVSCLALACGGARQRADRTDSPARSIMDMFGDGDFHGAMTRCGALRDQDFSRDSVADDGKVCAVIAPASFLMMGRDDAARELLAQGCQAATGSRAGYIALVLRSFGLVAAGRMSDSAREGGVQKIVVWGVNGCGVSAESVLQALKAQM